MIWSTMVINSIVIIIGLIFTGDNVIAGTTKQETRDFIVKTCFVILAILWTILVFLLFFTRKTLLTPTTTGSNCLR
ncbi:MAG TPA: hypothetical protein ENJ49_00775 [Candidatus Moranbacteria bacterium]|nr:hypothetical protein [Candidatus Moranbacteria bacterium]